MEAAEKVQTLREKARAAAEKKRKKPAGRNRVKVLIYKDMKKRLSARKPTPSAVYPCDDLVDDFLADLPPPTNAAMAALPAAIADEENGDTGPQCCIQ